MTELRDDDGAWFDVEDTDPDKEAFYKEHTCNFVDTREVKCQLIPTKATEVDKEDAPIGYIARAGEPQQQAARYAQQLASMQKGYNELVAHTEHQRNRIEQLEKEVGIWITRAQGRAKSIAVLKEALRNAHRTYGPELTIAEIK